MDASPTKAERLSLNRQDDFMTSRKKQSRRRENKVELKLTWNVWEARSLSFTKSPKFKDHALLWIFSFDFQRENALESL
jgi:hypothetical protein